MDVDPQRGAQAKRVPSGGGFGDVPDPWSQRNG